MRTYTAGDVVKISLPIIWTGGAKSFRNTLEGECMSTLLGSPCDPPIDEPYRCDWAARAREGFPCFQHLRSQNIFAFHNIDLTCISKKECGFRMIRAGFRAKGCCLLSESGYIQQRSPSTQRAWRKVEWSKSLSEARIY